jgi:hypothetical protein
MSLNQDIIDLLVKLGIKIPLSLTWQPTYEPQDYIIETFPDGHSEKIPVSIHYRVTAETAEHLRQIYDPNGTVVEEPILGTGGPFSYVPTARALKFTDGTTIRAGDLAVVFSDQYPLDPAIADRIVKAILKSRGE